MQEPKCGDDCLSPEHAPAPSCPLPSPSSEGGSHFLSVQGEWPSATEVRVQESRKIAILFGHLFTVMLSCFSLQFSVKNLQEQNFSLIMNCAYIALRGSPPSSPHPFWEDKADPSIKILTSH